MAMPASVRTQCPSQSVTLVLRGPAPILLHLVSARSSARAEFRLSRWEQRMEVAVLASWPCPHKLAR